MLRQLRVLPFGLVSVVALISSEAIGAEMFMPEWTLTQLLGKCDAAVIAKVGDPPEIDVAKRRDTRTSPCIVNCVLKGETSLVGESVDARVLSEESNGELFLLVGKTSRSSKELRWRVAMSVTQAYQEHALIVRELETSGAQRLAFFRPFLGHADKLVAANAHLEFVIATDEAFYEACEQLDRATLRQWLSAPDVAVDRQRLYLAMLAQQGDESDGEWLQSHLLANETPSLLDIQIGCFLALKGEASLPLVKRAYLENPSATFGETYSALSGLRFVRDMPNSPLSKESMASSFRLLLGNIRLADLVVLDLIDLEDWESLDRLVELSKAADSEWIRVPVAHFLRACPTAIAKERLNELSELDPAAVRRAENFFGPLQEARKRVVLRRHYAGQNARGC